jgi:predicted RNase H-like HicB family nuclease
MEYRIPLVQSEEGWAVSCPTLPGCYSQGVTREEAVENIKIAIKEWLEVEADEGGMTRVEEDVVAL